MKNDRKHTLGYAWPDLTALLLNMSAIMLIECLSIFHVVD